MSVCVEVLHLISGVLGLKRVSGEVVLDLSEVTVLVNLFCPLWGASVSLSLLPSVFFDSCSKKIKQNKLHI